MKKILPVLKKAGIIYLKVVGVFLAIILLVALLKSGKSSGGTYVEGTIDKNGNYRKGYVRKAFSTDPNAISHRNASSKYYHTKGKYLR